MIEKNKQKASNISNSNVQQANGNINNYGVSYNDVKEICRDVIRQEFQIVTKEAVDKLNKLIEEFQNQLIEKIAELKDQEVIGKFKEPRYQFVLHDAIKEYAQADNEETKEDLVDILIDRLQVDENSTERFVVEDAIKIIPKLSYAITRFLGSILMRRMEERNLPFIFRKNLNEQAKLYEHLDEISNLDIAYLFQLNCCEQMHGYRHMVTIEEEMRQRYDLFFRQPTTIDDYNKYVASHPILAPGINGLSFVCVDGVNSKVCRMAFLSSMHLKDHLQKAERLNIWPELDNYIKTLRPYNDEEIKDFLIEINPNWWKIIDLFHQEDVQSLQLTPVGTYIANRVVQKEKMRVAKATLKELY